MAGVGDVEDRMARSDLIRGNAAGSTSLPSVGSASLLALLHARRGFHGAERNFRILVFGRRRWWVISAVVPRHVNYVAFCRRPKEPSFPTLRREHRAGVANWMCFRLGSTL